jgi:anti-anti-sigma regulatory factor
MAGYEVSDRDGVQVRIRLFGELLGDASTARVEDDLERHYVDDGVQEIRVDLAEVPHITLEGVAVLLRLRMASDARGKRLVVENPSGQVMERLKTTGVLGFLSQP